MTSSRGSDLGPKLIGDSPAFRDVLVLIERLATCDVSVILLGETGTGKELAARAIHYLGARGSRPFIPVNCGAIPETLVESELFGHCRGAFTDAKDNRSGLVSQAEGGTLFLDEVDALSQKGQVALLRFLQDGHFRPLGSRTLCTSNVRIIAATNADLLELSAAGAFRSDLLYRLMIVPVELPPLRKRGADVVLLAEHFVRRLSHQYSRPPARIHPGCVAELERYHWPGNVRELENLIHRQFVLQDGEDLHVRVDATGMGATSPAATPACAPSATMARGSLRAAKAAAIAEFERNFLRGVLSESAGNVSRAAERAGKERRSFGRLLKKHGIDKRSFIRSAP